MIDLFFGENLFLVILALVWLVGATMQDFSRREIDDWWNYSLIFFALSYRFIFSLFSSDYTFFLNGLIGLAIFFALGNLFYYARLFAGGDAKLLYSLGAILPLSYSWAINFQIFLVFILGSFLLGAIYSLIYCFVLIFYNPQGFSKEFKSGFFAFKFPLIFSGIFCVLFSLIGIFFSRVLFVYFGIIILIFPFLFIFGKSVEESCLIRKVSWKKVTEGDWLYKDFKIGKKILRANWQGISKRELALIQKSKKDVWIKYGIPFGISFLLGFLGLFFWFSFFGF